MSVAAAIVSTTSWRCNEKTSTCEAKKVDPVAASSTASFPSFEQDGPRLIFIGTGSSTGCPKPICSLLFPPSGTSKPLNLPDDSPLLEVRESIRDRCKVSSIASIGDPKHNKNYRNNPSLLISHQNNDDSKNESDEKANIRNVIIDVGKTFREGALRWMPHHRIASLDAVVITHGHADAVLGLDDIRGFQTMPHMFPSGRTRNFQSMPVFMSSECFDVIKQTFGYLVPKEVVNNKVGESNNKVKRAVASLDFKVVENFKPFIAAGLTMVPLPVWHGSDLICNGYAFTVTGKNGSPVNVVYLSDISEMIPETAKFILEDLPPTDILVVDSLLYDRPNPVHFSLTQAIDLAKILQPKRTFIVGINCDDFPEHDQTNEQLKDLDIDIQLAHDGLSIEL